MKTRVCLKDFAHVCLWKLTPGSFKVDFFNNFGNYEDLNTVLT